MNSRRSGGVRWLRLGVAGLIFLVSVEAYAARVYYVNQPEGGAGVINSVKPDGSDHVPIYTSGTVTDLRGIAADPITSSIFFAYAEISPVNQTRTQVSIRRIPSAGGSPVTLTNLPEGTFMADVEWDDVNGRVYFAQTGDGLLRRMKPDGTELSTVITTVGDGQGPYFFGLDLLANLAYWGIGTSPNQVNTAFSRGSLVTGIIDPDFTLITPSRTRDIGIDPSVPGGQIYWCDRQMGAVYRRAVNGGPVLFARNGLNAPHGLVLDVEAGMGYVADTGKRGNGSQPSSHRVVRFNLDGSGGLEFLSPFDALAEPWDVAVDFSTANYLDWRTRFFSTTATGAGPTDDPDGDGRPNYAEYAFFTHPARPDAASQSHRVEGRQFRYPRRKLTDVPVRVEVSTDAQTWHWNGDSPGAVWTEEISVSPRDADSVWVIAALAPTLAGEPQIYFRLGTVPTPAFQSAPSRRRSLRKLRR